MSAFGDSSAGLTHVDARSIADELWRGGCHNAQAINRFLEKTSANGNDMDRVMKEIIATDLQVLRPDGSLVMPVDLPDYLKGLAVQSQEAEPDASADLRALANASSAYLVGGRAFMTGSTAAFVGGSPDPRGDFARAKESFISAADQSTPFIARIPCTQWLKQNP
jgi:hypothetical protein